MGGSAREGCAGQGRGGRRTSLVGTQHKVPMVVGVPRNSRQDPRMGSQQCWRDQPCHGVQASPAVGGSRTCLEEMLSGRVKGGDRD